MPANQLIWRQVAETTAMHNRKVYFTDYPTSQLFSICTKSWFWDHTHVRTAVYPAQSLQMMKAMG